MSNVSPCPVGYRNLAESYLSCVRQLTEDLKRRRLILGFDAPLYALLAHSFELATKAQLLLNGYSMDHLEKEVRHNLLRAFEDLKRVSPGLCAQTEQHVLTEWRHTLRQLRDVFQSNFVDFGISDPKTLEDLGVHSDNTIERELPKLSRDLAWLSNRHMKGGSQFRYLVTGPDQRQHIRAFGIDEHTDLKSVTWATEYLIEN